MVASILPNRRRENKCNCSLFNLGACARAVGKSTYNFSLFLHLFIATSLYILDGKIYQHLSYSHWRCPKGHLTLVGKNNIMPLQQ